MKQNKMKSPESFATLRKKYLIEINNQKEKGPKAFIKCIQNADYC